MYCDWCLVLVIVELSEAVDNWVLGGAEAHPNIWHLCLKAVAHNTQHTTAYWLCNELLIGCVVEVTTRKLKQLVYGPVECYSDT